MFHHKQSRFCIETKQKTMFDAAFTVDTILKWEAFQLWFPKTKSLKATGKYW